MLSTFGGFSIAKLGIRASQQGLQITGNNISNINTDGYTRQRINQISLHAGVADRYACSTDVRIGMGTLVTNVSQIRDPYLDIRYRNEASSVGYYDQKLSGLEDLMSALDEVSKDGLHTAIENLRNQLNTLANPDNVGNLEYDTIVRSAAQELVSLLNSYSAQLDTLRENAVTGLNQDVDAVNEILNNIRDLNEEIRTSHLHGDSALELLDRRNVLIDQLSEYTKIKVTYVDEKITETQTVQKLIIELDAPGQDPANRLTLIDGLYANQLELKNPDPNAQPPAAATEDYDIGLTGLKDKYGDSPLVNQIQEQMDKLNLLTSALSGVNKSMNQLHGQSIDWANDVVQAGFNQNGVDDFADVGKKRQELQDAVKNALDAYRKNPTDATKKDWQDAQNKLNSYNRLAERKNEIDRQYKSLDSQKTGYLKSLETQLNTQGLNYNIATDPSGAISITVSGAPGQLADTPLLNADGTIVNKFSAEPVVDAATNQPTGDYDLKLGTETFKTYTQNEIDAAADVAPDGLNDGDLYGALQAELEYLNGKGEFEKDGATDVRGLTYYQRSLDTLAQTFAKTFNDLNNIDHDDTTNDNLFESKDPNAPITAGNIKISDGWLDGTVRIHASTNLNPPEGSKDNTNVLNMLNALTGKHDFYALDKDGNPIQDNDGAGNMTERVLFNGSFEQMFTNMDAVLGTDVKTSTTLLNNYSLAATERAVSRDNLSTVDLNEEGINLIQYQKSFSAACRVMTTLDEMLNSLLNI